MQGGVDAGVEHALESGSPAGSGRNRSLAWAEKPAGPKPTSCCHGRSLAMIQLAGDRSEQGYCHTTILPRHLRQPACGNSGRLMRPAGGHLLA
jgi:hypothetical protein